MSQPLRQSIPHDSGARIGVLFARAAGLRGRLAAAASDAEADAALDEMETLTLEIAETPCASVDACHLKAALLRDRLLEMLDHATPGELATLALAASLVVDLGRLDR
jgi:hypothetical protein